MSRSTNDISLIRLLVALWLINPDTPPKTRLSDGKHLEFSWSEDQIEEMLKQARSGASRILKYDEDQLPPVEVMKEELFTSLRLAGWFITLAEDGTTHIAFYEEQDIQLRIHAFTVDYIRLTGDMEIPVRGPVPEEFLPIIRPRQLPEQWEGIVFWIEEVEHWKGRSSKS